MAQNSLTELVNRLSGKVIISSEITCSDVETIDSESLIAHTIKHFENGDGMKILDREALQKIIASVKKEKEPVQIEIIRSSDFKPTAKDVESTYSYRSPKIERTTSTVSDFVDYFNDRFNRLRGMMKNYGNGSGVTINSMDAIKKYMGGREIGVIGMVFDKITTKNGHILVTLEDESGTAKVLFLKPQKIGKDAIGELFESATKLVKDDVVYVKGKISGPFVIANRLLWPDVPIRIRRGCEEDVAIAFVSDLHTGSRLFLEKQFGKFLEWLNGNVDNKKEIAGKIKYVVIGGDLVDGVGVYPEQQRELTIDDIYKQYSFFFDFVSHIPDYIEVFVLPGNHDAVQKSEPQPQISKDLANGFEKDNVHMVANPCCMNLHGVKVLSYHGASLDPIIQNIRGCTYFNPEEGMKEIIKRRHLSPIYGGNVITPSKTDSLVIDEVPDILHMGHVHKNGYDEYHGTALINSGTWQARTGFQIRLGHIPTPALLPVYEAKSMSVTTIDFNE